MKFLDVAQDLRSARLLRCCQGVAAAGLTDEDAAKKLVAHARAVRLLLESGDAVLVDAAISRIRTVLKEIKTTPKVQDAVEKHLRSLEQVLR